MPKTLVRPTSRGQITLPKSVRQQANVDADTFLDVSVKGKDIILRPVQFVEDRDEDLRDYSDAQIKELLEDDKISKENAEFVNKLLGTDKY